MKKIFFPIIISFICLTGCFKSQDLLFDEMKLIEFETAVRTSPTTSVGASFPIIATTRTSGTLNQQVNLVGEQFSQARSLKFSVDTTINNYLKVYNASSLTTIRAEEGVHFNLKGGVFTINEKSSIGTVSFDVLNPGANTGKFALLVLKLDGDEQIKPSENYRRIGFRINLN